jgi:acylphosphatase
MSTDRIIRHVAIHGHVQRVGYRAWTEHIALQRGLEGWVRNRADGTVEAVFAGSAAAVEAMVETCRRGPPGARVEHIEEREGRPEDIALRRVGEMFSVLMTEDRRRTTEDR